ncbi:hypothetical protein [Thermobrachium celere]|uniref:hypothetical protein n=1 Tax=Thermobrachium celere TaxID=53422 RepID=UPI00194556E3|nr:hypothetical protein [Thermobrachium celere]GFR35460.1 hypothetical protein TCEA9_12720 [Thermobrachium celere]
MIDISKYGITKVLNLKKDNNENKYTKYKYNKAMKLLKQLNMNPILIPKNEKVPSYIKNPLADI